VKEREAALAQKEKEGAETLKDIQQRDEAMQAREQLLEKVLPPILFSSFFLYYGIFLRNFFG
jgi:hypothetical protein